MNRVINDSTDTVEGAREINVDGRAKILLYRVNRHTRLKDDSRLKNNARLGTFLVFSLPTRITCLLITITTKTTSGSY